MPSTLTLTNLTGFKRGVTSDETGLNIREIKTTVQPELKEFLKNKQNLNRGFATGPMQKEVNIQGEISGLTGVLAATATTAFAPANSTAYFGAPTTGLYLDKAEVTESRDAWWDLSADFSAHAGID